MQLHLIFVLKILFVVYCMFGQLRLKLKKKHLSNEVSLNICELFPEGTCEVKLHNVCEM